MPDDVVPQQDQDPSKQQMDPSQLDKGQGAFDEAEIKNLREIFDLFDKDQRGYIEVQDLETIMKSLQRNPAEVRDFIENLDPNTDGRITFEELLNLLQKIENKIANMAVVQDGGQMMGPDGTQMQQSDLQMQLAGEMQEMQSRGVINVTADSKVLDFLRLLEEYRRKCEEQGNYAEARKSRSKFDELLKKETQRQRNNIKAA